MVSLKNQIRLCVKAQLLLGGLLLLVATSFYFLGYRPSTRRDHALDVETASMRQELIDNTGRSGILPSVIKEVKNLQLRVESAKQMPKVVDTGAFAKDVARISRTTQLRNVVFHVADAPHRMELFSLNPVQLQLQGNFDNVRAFLRELESLPRLARVRSISIKGDSTAKEPGDVIVNMDVDLYFSPDL